MTRTIRLLIIPALLLAGACGDGGDDVSWSARFTGSEGDSTSAGGAIVVFEENAVLDDSGWILESPIPYPYPLPLPDLAAVGDALARTDWQVLDAVFTAEGTVALLDGGDGPRLLLLGEDPASAAVPPADASRLVPDGEAPLRVLVVLGEEAGAAIIAVRYAP